MVPLRSDAAKGSHGAGKRPIYPSPCPCRQKGSTRSMGLITLVRIGIDAAVLMFLLKVVNDEDVDFATAFFVALGASIGTGVLVWLLAATIGFAGMILAAIIAAALLGVAVSALFGAEIKRSFLIGVLFVVLHVGVSIGFSSMLGA